jgi:dolichol-phosphate mannosyltransferase
VTTTWNERETIEELIQRTRTALKQYPHEIIVIDDSSQDETIEIAKRLADMAITKPRKGQSQGLLYGMKLAKYPVIVTIDADLENPPEHIPELVELTKKFDVVVASRIELPRISEKIASKTLGKLLGVTDTLSNYRAYKKEAIHEFIPRCGETFGAEFLVAAKKNHLKIGEFMYDPPPRRTNPRIGGTIKANLRIIWALMKCLALYFT